MPGQTTATGTMRVFPQMEALITGLADWLLERSLAKSGSTPFRLALSGGSSPQHLYALMASAPYVERFPWRNMQFFIGDDRFVPHDHADSNFGMMQRLLFSKAPIPAANIFPMPDRGPAEEAAKTYERTLKNLYGAENFTPERPFFDVQLLGVGTDGHTASLFPGQPVLDNHKDWVATCVPPAAPHTRLTLTYPAIHASQHVVFLVEGAAKHDILARIRAQDPACPASAITAQGELIWFTDRAAAPSDQ
ncbi:6-phosphogluconolactonase [Acetobacter lambici]|uniref:6-phosphogluconolactonase n=1 Tax=Acetobacter lambici TaxID=1332824 RepID=A0ABT1F231_9PROT|nr:6-phosphogluconolactonase [Acetobacter lambici]MCP1243293.1 6-phosphogluconolactonase [Acetobacter lambici]MCP1259268.1 6-phosphogluconolactonase [Acetobacter lambici]NHO57425.1 6-phosphogluconolactonase [Acetobacter lambici]